MGYIDPFSDYTLYDVVEGNIPDPGKHFIEYEGFHIVPQGNDTCHVQLDGHVGTVMEIEPDEYDDVLDLVSDLNGLLIRLAEYEYQDDKDELVEWAGKIMTSDKERADEHPEHYIHIPDNAPPSHEA